MDLVTVIEQFPDQEACIEHFRAIRWGDTPQCPKCEGFAIVGHLLRLPVAPCLLGRRYRFRSGFWLSR